MIAALRNDPLVQAVASLVVIVALSAFGAGIIVGMAWERAERSSLRVARP